MRIYTIRDRLIDYYNAPFVAPNDKEAMAGVAMGINHPESTNAIAQAPHHFELYRLGDVTEEGTIVPNKEFLLDCAALVRAKREPAERGTTPTPAT